jgi:hypothetical protein
MRFFRHFCSKKRMNIALSADFLDILDFVVPAQAGMTTLFCATEDFVMFKSQCK